jgi:hypothetical protein
MALKGHLWFLGKCLDEERDRSALSYLSSKALDLGLKRTESTRGHVFQAVGALQGFYAARPDVQAVAQNASTFTPYSFAGANLRAWREWFDPKSGTYGHARFGYNYTTLYGYLTPKFGGKRTGGGGGDNEFEIVARLLADFL